MDCGDFASDAGKIIKLAAELNLDYVLFSDFSFSGSVWEAGSIIPDLRKFDRKISGEKLSTAGFKDYIRISCESLCSNSTNYGIPLRIRRILPHDFRRENYWLAEKLANIAYMRLLRSLSYHQYLRAARFFNNLKNDIRNLIREQEFYKLLTFGKDVKMEIDSLIRGNWINEDSQQKRGLSLG